MTDIDWSKAPEGATHWAIRDGLFNRWHNEATKSFYNETTRRWCSYGYHDDFADAFLDAIPRPLKPEWDGKGLPPVGMECEYFDAINKKWVKSAIVAHHINGEEAIWSESLDGGCLFYGTPDEFRPLRTERDRAIEDILRVCEKDPDCSRAREQAGKIYDAGYRKP